MRYRELIEATPEKPEPPKAGVKNPTPPMTPAQSRRDAERKASLNNRIQDQRSECNRKIQDLRTKLVRRS